MRGDPAESSLPSQVANEIIINNFLPSLGLPTPWEQAAPCRRGHEDTVPNTLSVLGGNKHTQVRMRRRRLHPCLACSNFLVCPHSQMSTGVVVAWVMHLQCLARVRSTVKMWHCCHTVLIQKTYKHYIFKVSASSSQCSTSLTFLEPVGSERAAVCWCADTFIHLRSSPFNNVNGSLLPTRWAAKINTSQIGKQADMLRIGCS